MSFRAWIGIIPETPRALAQIYYNVTYSGYLACNTITFNSKFFYSEFRNPKSEIFTTVYCIVKFVFIFPFVQAVQSVPLLFEKHHPSPVWFLIPGIAPACPLSFPHFLRSV